MMNSRGSTTPSAMLVRCRRRGSSGSSPLGISRWKTIAKPWPTRWPVSSGRSDARGSEDVMKVAILDDYQNVALKLADWSAVRRQAELTVFNDHVADTTAVIERLRSFDVVCVMRERTPLTREVLQQLPQLKLIASTGPRNASINSQTATDLGIAVTATGYDSTPTIEFTWSLILASMRGIDREAASLNAGGWQTSLGSNLRGRSLGVVGLGHRGRETAGA